MLGDARLENNPATKGRVTQTYPLPYQPQSFPHSCLFHYLLILLLKSFFEND